MISRALQIGKRLLDLRGRKLIISGGEFFFIATGKILFKRSIVFITNKTKIASIEEKNEHFLRRVLIACRSA